MGCTRLKKPLIEYCMRSALETYNEQRFLVLIQGRVGDTVHVLARRLTCMRNK